MNIQTTYYRLLQVKMKKKCHLCKAEIAKGIVHLEETTHYSNDYPRRRNMCVKCSKKFIDNHINELKDTLAKIDNKDLTNECLRPFNIMKL